MKIIITPKSIQLTESKGFNRFTFVFFPTHVALTPIFLEKNETNFYAIPNEDGKITDHDLCEIFMLREMEGELELVGPYFDSGYIMYTVAFKGTSTQPEREAALLQKHRLQFITTL